MFHRVASQKAAGLKRHEAKCLADTCQRDFWLKNPAPSGHKKLLLGPAFSKAHRSDKMKRDCSIFGLVLAANGFTEAVTEIFVT